MPRASREVGGCFVRRHGTRGPIQAALAGFNARLGAEAVQPLRGGPQPSGAVPVASSAVLGRAAPADAPRDPAGGGGCAGRVGRGRGFPSLTATEFWEVASRCCSAPRFKCEVTAIWSRRCCCCSAEHPRPACEMRRQDVHVRAVRQSRELTLEARCRARTFHTRSRLLARDRSARSNRH